MIFIWSEIEFVSDRRRRVGKCVKYICRFLLQNVLIGQHLCSERGDERVKIALSHLLIERSRAVSASSYSHLPKQY